MKNEKKQHRIILLVLSLTILLTLIFIFGNSMASPKSSGAVSQRVNEIIEAAVETITGKENTSLEKFLVAYSRKIAHVVEFAMLGIQIMLWLHFARLRSGAHLLSGALLGFFVAAIDEGIQIFSGRGDLVSDIWIDVSGYITAYGLGMLILYLFSWRKRKEHTNHKKRKDAEES